MRSPACFLIDCRHTKSLSTDSQLFELGDLLSREDGDTAGASSKAGERCCGLGGFDRCYVELALSPPCEKGSASLLDVPSPSVLPHERPAVIRLQVDSQVSFSIAFQGKTVTKLVRPAQRVTAVPLLCGVDAPI